MTTSSLKEILKAAAAEQGCSMEELTVLIEDPYRLDTDAGHERGVWLGSLFDRLIRKPRIHWRGLHYAIVSEGGVIKPNNQLFMNNDPDWKFMSEKAGKCARFLGYIPFDRIFDSAVVEQCRQGLSTV